MYEFWGTLGLQLPHSFPGHLFGHAGTLQRFAHSASAHWFVVPVSVSATRGRTRRPSSWGSAGGGVRSSLLTMGHFSVFPPNS